MTLAKAHKLLDLMIKHKLAAKEDVIDPKKQWNREYDIMRSAASTVADGIENDIEWLMAIKEQLPPP